MSRSSVAGTRQCPTGLSRSAQGARGRPRKELVPQLPCVASAGRPLLLLLLLPRRSARRAPLPPSPDLHVLKLYLRNARLREGGSGGRLAAAARPVICHLPTKLTLTSRVFRHLPPLAERSRGATCSAAAHVRGCGDAIALCGREVLATLLTLPVSPEVTELRLPVKALTRDNCRPLFTASGKDEVLGMVGGKGGGD